VAVEPVRLLQAVHLQKDRTQFLALLHLQAAAMVEVVPMPQLPEVVADQAAAVVTLTKQVEQVLQDKVMQADPVYYPAAMRQVVEVAVQVQPEVMLRLRRQVTAATEAHHLLQDPQLLTPAVAAVVAILAVLRQVVADQVAAVQVVLRQHRHHLARLIAVVAVVEAVTTTPLKPEAQADQVELLFVG
jgi:hypothetical protein